MASESKKDDEQKNLKSALDQIEKAFGEGAIMQLSGTHSATVDGISTGSLSLDLALGGRGFPRGRVIEVFGQESSGKTTVALHAIANAQKSGGVAAFIDAEHALDPSWAKRLGVDLEGLLVSQPSSGEEALKIAEMLIRSNAVDIIVIDSVAALVPRVEVEGEIGDSHVGLQARLMSQALRILNPTVAKTRTCLVFINQIRQKIGNMGYGDPNTTTGGLALKFYASVRISVTRTGQVKEKEETIGSEVRVKVVKNKVAPPFRQAEFELMYDHGISREADVINMAMEDKIIDKSGSWLSYGGVRLGQGKQSAIQYLRDNPAVLDEITQKVLTARGFDSDGQKLPEPTEEAAAPAPAPEAAPEKPSRRRAASASGE